MSYKSTAKSYALRHRTRSGRGGRCHFVVLCALVAIVVLALPFVSLWIAKPIAASRALLVHRHHHQHQDQPQQLLHEPNRGAHALEEQIAGLEKQLQKAFDDADKAERDLERCRRELAAG